MKEVRLSIPIIGGITVIYTADEVEQKKQAAKKHALAFAQWTGRVLKQGYSLACEVPQAVRAFKQAHATALAEYQKNQEAK